MVAVKEAVKALSRIWGFGEVLPIVRRRTGHVDESIRGVAVLRPQDAQFVGRTA